MSLLPFIDTDVVIVATVKSPEHQARSPTGAMTMKMKNCALHRRTVVILRYIVR